MTTSFPAVADAERISRWPVLDEDGDRIGVIDALYGDTADGTLEWASVEVGVVGRRHLVPLADAFVGDGFLQVGYDRGRVEQSPRPDQGTDLDAGTERALYEHYGLPWEDETAGAGHVPEGDDADGATQVLVRRPSLLERFAYA